MRRWPLVIPLASLVLCLQLGCRGSKTETRSATKACSNAELIEAGRVLDAIPADLKPARVWPQLVSACGNSIPKPIAIHFEEARETHPASDAIPEWLDPAFDGMMIQACPRWSEVAATLSEIAPDQRTSTVFRACDFARYGVLTADEAHGSASLMVSWGLHQWLLDQGLTPAQAKPITRALIALDHQASSPNRPIPGQFWPVARGFPLEDGLAVYVTRDAIKLDGQTILRRFNRRLAERDVEDGVILPVHAALQAALEARRSLDEPTPRLLVAADRDTPFSILGDLLYTADQAGVKRQSILVDSVPYGFSQVPIAVRSYADEPINPSPRTLTITFQTYVRLSSSDHARITDHAKAAKRAAPELTEVVLEIGDDEIVENLVEFITAVRGPDCAADGTGCVLQEVIVLVGSRKAVGPSDATNGMGGTIGTGNAGLIRTGPPPGPRTRVEETKPVVVEGSHGADLIHRIVRTHRTMVGSCLKLGVDEPARAEQVPIRFVIAADGRVPTATVEQGSSADAAVAKCVAKVARRWRFPKPSDGDEVIVKISFTLHAEPP